MPNRMNPAKVRQLLSLPRMLVARIKKEAMINKKPISMIAEEYMSACKIELSQAEIRRVERDVENARKALCKK